MVTLASGVLLSAAGVADYVNPTGFQTDRESGASVEKIFLTYGYEYRNNNDNKVGGAVLNTSNRMLLSNGSYDTETIFMPTGVYASGVGISQGSFTARSGVAYELVVYATGSDGKFDGSACSVSDSPRGIVVFKNEEAVRGDGVQYAVKQLGASDTVDKVLYNDSSYFFHLRPQSTAIFSTGGAADTFMFVACTGHTTNDNHKAGTATSPTALISYYLLPN
jgi:hypothetical protein